MLGPTRTYTVSQSWIEVSYSDLTHNAGKVLYQLGPDVIPLAIVQGNGYGHGATFISTCIIMHSPATHFPNSKSHPLPIAYIKGIEDITKAFMLSLTAVKSCLIPCASIKFQVLEVLSMEYKESHLGNLR